MKFRSFRIHALIILFSAFLTMTVSAASGQKGVRPCLTSDLIGTWELRNLSSKVKIDPNDSFGWPYQRFAFDRKGDVKEMMSTTSIEGDAAAVKKFGNMASISKFSVDERGIMSITKIESPMPEHCMCSYATKDVPAEVLAKLPEAKRSQFPHQGDIVLTYMSRKGQPIVIKTLRKI